MASLHADPANTRRHDEKNLTAISDSLRTFGQVEPLVVQAGTGKVIGGNGRQDVGRDGGRARSYYSTMTATPDSAEAIAARAMPDPDAPNANAITLAAAIDARLDDYHVHPIPVAPELRRAYGIIIAKMMGSKHSRVQARGANLMHKALALNLDIFEATQPNGPDVQVNLAVNVRRIVIEAEPKGEERP